MASTEEELWRAYASTYRFLFGILPLKAMFGEVVAAANLAGNMRVIDLGCGTGFLLQSLQEAPGPRPSVTCLDASSEMLGQAQRVRYDGLAEFRLADLNQPVSAWRLSTLFDRLILVNSLYAVSDPAGLLTSLTEIAAPGAVLVISTPRSDPDMEAIVREHLRMFAAMGGDPGPELQRITTELSPVAEINRQILGNRQFHFADEATLRRWLETSGWAIKSLTTTYAGQNWLVVAQEGRHDDRDPPQHMAG